VSRLDKNRFKQGLKSLLSFIGWRVPFSEKMRPSQRLKGEENGVAFFRHDRGGAITPEADRTEGIGPQIRIDEGLVFYANPLTRGLFQAQGDVSCDAGALSPFLSGARSGLVIVRMTQTGGLLVFKPPVLSFYLSFHFEIFTNILKSMPATNRTVRVRVFVRIFFGLLFVPKAEEDSI